MERPTLIHQDRVLYKVEVGSNGLPTSVYSDVGYVKLLPTDPPVLLLYDRDNNHKAMITIVPGAKVDFTVTETIKPAADIAPGSLLQYDFTNKVH